MSTTVDNRVVNMQFNNQQFEAGVKQTISSLDSLKKSLDLNTNATSSLSNVQKAFDSFSVKNIEQNIQSLTDRFSTMGIVGMTVIQNLTNSITNFVKSKVSTAYNQILTGGWNRASSIAQARFTLEGLFANEVDGAEKVEKAMNSAMDSVTGTSYTMASAAAAASQLAASGVDVGEDMYNTLRSIAGVASMTGDTFDSVANIFTTVAGNGRLMGMQLTQLSSHGLNAAATIADYLHSTEAEVRDMVSKGEISFETFSAAMQHAFGEQAGKANTTFSGTMENIKSQLSKIGEIFGTGIVENKSVIIFLNNVRIALGKIKDIIGGRLKNSFADMMTALSKLGSIAVKIIDTTGFKKFIDIVGAAMDKVTQFSNVFIKFSDAAKAHGIVVDKITSVSERQANIAKKIFEGSEAWGKTASEQQKALGVEYKYVKAYLDDYTQAAGEADKMTIRVKGDAVNTGRETAIAMGYVSSSAEEAAESFNPLAIILESIKTFGEGLAVVWESVKKGASSVGEALTSVYSFFDFTNDVKFLGEMFSKIAKIFEITDERAEKLRSAFAGLFTVLNFIKRVYKGLANVLIKSFGPIASDIFDVILSTFSAIGKLIIRIDKWEKRTGVLSSTFELFGKIITKLYGGIKEFFDRVSKLESFKKFQASIKDTSNEIGGKLAPAFKKLMTWLNAAVDSTEKTSFLDTFVNMTDKALKILNKLFDKSSSIISKFFSLFNDDKDNSKTGVIDSATEKVGKADGLFGRIKNLTSKSKDSVDNVRGIINTVLDIFVDISKKALDIFNNLDIAKVLLITFGVGINMMVFNANKLLNKGSNFITRITNVFNPKKGANIVGILNAIVKVILALTAALVILSSIDSTKLKTSSLILLGMMAGVAGFTILIAVMSSKIKEFQKSSAMIASMSRIITSFSAAVYILAMALKTLSEIKWGDWNDWGKTILSLVAIIFALTGAMIIMQRFGGNGEAAKHLMAMGLSVYLIVSSLNLLTKIDMEGIYKKLLALVAFYLTLGVLIGIANRIKIRKVLAMLVLIAVLALLELALWGLMEDGVGLDDVKKNLDKLGVVFGLLAILTGMINGIKGGHEAQEKVEAIADLMDSLVWMALALWIVGKADTPNIIVGAFALKSMLTAVIQAYNTLATCNNDERKTAKNIKLLTKFVKSIVVLALAAAVLSLLPLVGLAGAVGAILGLIEVLSLAIKKMQDTNSSDYSSMTALTKMITRFARAMLLITLSLIALVLAIGTNYKGALLATLALISIIRTIVNSIVKLNKSQKSAGRLDTGLLIELAIFLSGIVLIILALALLVTLSKDPWNLVISGIVIVGVLVSLVEAVRILNGMTLDTKLSNILALTQLIFGVIIVAGSLAILSRTFEDVQLGSIVLAVLSIAAVMLSLVFALSVIASLPSTGFANLQALDALIISIAVIALSLKVLLLGGLDVDKLKVAVHGIVEILLVLSIAMVIMSAVTPSVQSIALLITVIALIAVLAITLKPIANGVEALAKSLSSLLSLGIVSLSLQLSLLAVAGALLAVVLIPLGLGAILFGTGLLLMGVGFKATGAGLITFSKGLTALDKALAKVDMLSIIGLMAGIVAIGLILAPIIAVVGGALLILGGAFVVIGIGALAIASAILLGSVAFTGMVLAIQALSIALSVLTPILSEFGEALGDTIIELGKSFGLAIVEFMRALADNKDVIVESIEAFVEILVEIVVSGIKFIFGVLTEALAALIDSIGDLAEPLIGALAKIFVALGEHAEEFGYYGFMIIDGFLAGIMDYFDEHSEEIGDRIVEFVVKLGKLLLKVLTKLGNLLIDKAKGIGLKIEAGIMDFFSSEGDYNEEIQEAYDKAYAERQKLLDAGKTMDDEEVKKYTNMLIDFERYLKTNKSYTERLEEGQRLEAEEKLEEAGKLAKEEAFEEEMQEATDVDLSSSGDSSASTWIDSAAKKYENFSLDDKLGNMFSNGKEIGEGGATETSQAFMKTVTKSFKESSLPSDVVEQYLLNGWERDGQGNLTKQVQEQLDGVEVSTAGLINVEVLYKTMNDVVEDMKKLGVETGKEYLRGVIAGLKDITLDSTLYNTAKVSAKRVDEAFRDGLDEHSPSRKGIQSGKDYILGVNNGIKALMTLPANTASVVADTLVNTFGTTLDTIYENVDKVDGLSPTITPVVDTSSINNTKNMLMTASPLADMNIGDITTQTSLAFNQANQNNLATQVAALTEQVNKLANQDYSTMFDGVSFNIDASTNVDGAPLKSMASKYTIEQIDDTQRGLVMAGGGRI